jgi:AraC-like DNA-binding protein/ligand-binding sensor protein
MKETKRKNENSPKNYYNNLLDKTVKMMLVYIQATGSNVCIYDYSYKPLFLTETGKGIENSEQPHDKSLEKAVCPHCARFFSEAGNKIETFPCHGMHIDAIREANKKGGSYTYRCGMGFIFWTSPIYTEGIFSGALRGYGFIDPSYNKNDAGLMSNNTIPPEEFIESIESFPVADNEKVHSLAEMLLLCAEALSSGTEDYHEILRRRTEQQKIMSQLINELKTKHPEGTVKPGYPLDTERMLIAALRKGDSVQAKKLLNELLAILLFSNPGHFKYIQLRTTELVVLLSRVEVSPGKGGTLALETSSRSLKSVQEAKTIEELTDILHTIVERISAQISSFQGIPHAVALRKAESFIWENYTRKISLQEIADVAGLSAPYFSTIFKEEMGENLSKYLNRLRVERASRLLLETEMSLSDIASACCFEDQSWFSKIFKAYTGISPGKYRNQGGGMVKQISENNLSEDFLKTIK